MILSDSSLNSLPHGPINGTHFRRTLWWKALLYSGVLLAFLETVEYLNIPALSYGVFGIGIVILLINIHFGIVYYFSVFLLSNDTPLESVGDFGTALTTVHTVDIGGIAIMPVWTIMLLFYCLIVVMHKMESKVIILSIFDKLIVTIGVLFVFAFVIGLRNIYEAPRIVISDASFYINMVAAYLSVRVFFRSERRVRLLTIVTISCLGVYAIKGVIFYIVGIGEISSHIVKPVMDSMRNLFPLLVFLGVSLMYMGRIQDSNRSIIYVFSFAGLFNTLVYSSRGNLFFLLVGVLLSVWLLSRVKFDGAGRGVRLLKATTFVSIMAGITFVYMEFLREGSLNYIFWKIQSLANFDILAQEGLGSTAVRLLESINIYYGLIDDGNILWGEGLGGYFTDSYIPYANGLIGATAYNEDWILEGKLYKPHGTPLFVMLKLGIGGLLIYYLALALFFMRSWRSAKVITSRELQFIFVSFLAFLPLLYYKNFTSKLQITLGLLMALIVNIIDLYNKSRQRNLWINSGSGRAPRVLKKVIPIA